MLSHYLLLATLVTLSHASTRCFLPVLDRLVSDVTDQLEVVVKSANMACPSCHESQRGKLCLQNLLKDDFREDIDDLKLTLTNLWKNTGCPALPSHVIYNSYTLDQIRFDNPQSGSVNFDSPSYVVAIDYDKALDRVIYVSDSSPTLYSNTRDGASEVGLALFSASKAGQMNGVAVMGPGVYLVSTSDDMFLWDGSQLQIISDLANSQGHGYNRVSYNPVDEKVYFDTIISFLGFGRMNVDGTDLEYIQTSGWPIFHGLDVIDQKLYYAKDSSAGVYRYDLRTRREKLIANLGKLPLGIHVDGEHLYLHFFRSVEERTLDGSLLRTIATAASDGYYPDVVAYGACG